MNNESPDTSISLAIALPLAMGYADLGLNGYNEFANAFQRSQDDGVLLSQEECIKAVAPAMVLAFAIEIFAKVLVFQRTGNYPRGHKLAQLIQCLPSSAHRSLKKNYKRCMDRPGRPLKLTYQINRYKVANMQELTPLGDGGSLGDHFEMAVAKASPLFAELRYLFEKVEIGFKADIDFSWLLYLLDAIRTEVFEYKQGEVTLTFGAGIF
jgi:hypothetical protein